jgi:hypothetical protein
VNKKAHWIRQKSNGLVTTGFLPDACQHLELSVFIRERIAFVKHDSSRAKKAPHLPNAPAMNT